MTTQAAGLRGATARALQAGLKAQGYDPGAIDGWAGPRTFGAFACYMAARDLGDRGQALGQGLADQLPRFNITAPLRLAHFMAQAAHETGGFRNLVELGSGDRDGDGRDDYLAKYDTRTDLGNTPQVDGDGELYRGRGIFQLTGRANYAQFGKLAGLDLVARPELAAEPANAVLLACLYWDARGLNRLADADDAQSITRKINGGFNGLNDRLDRLRRAKRALAIN